MSTLDRRAILGGFFMGFTARVPNSLGFGVMGPCHQTHFDADSTNLLVTTGDASEIFNLSTLSPPKQDLEPEYIAGAEEAPKIQGSLPCTMDPASPPALNHPKCSLGLQFGAQQLMSIHGEKTSIYQ